MQKKQRLFLRSPPSQSTAVSAASIVLLQGELLRVWEYYAGKNSIKPANSLAARVVRISPYQSVSVRTAAINRTAGLAPQSGASAAHTHLQHPHRRQALCSCKANTCLSRRSATKPDVPRYGIGKIWEGLGSIGKRAEPAAAGRRTTPASYTPGNASRPHNVAAMGGNALKNSQIFPIPPKTSQ